MPTLLQEQYRPRLRMESSIVNPKKLGVGARTAEFLHATYSKPRAKLIARDFRVSEGTAELWLKGKAPTTAHVEQMVAMFGEPYVRTVFAEAFARHDERIKRLKTSMVEAFVAGGIAGVMAGIAYAHGLLHDGAIAIGGLIGEAARLVGLPEPPFLLVLEPDPERTLLVQELVETVPALPAPSS